MTAKNARGRVTVASIPLPMDVLLFAAVVGAISARFPAATVKPIGGICDIQVPQADVDALQRDGWGDNEDDK